MIGPEPQCTRCKHLHPPSGPFGYACDAFPDGIPEEIFVDGFDHTQPFPGDQGIRFEAKE